MAEHLYNFWQLFKHDLRLHFYVMLYEGKEKNRAIDVNASREKLLTTISLSEVGSFSSHFRHWDLVVVADHTDNKLLTSICKTSTLYIGHSPNSKYRPEKSGTISYGKYVLDYFGNCVYDRMFVSTHKIFELAVKQNPELSKIAVVVGNINNDRIVAALSERNRFRHTFGFRPDDIVVLVLSTWRKECLFESVGDELLQEARKLMKEFKFILTIHPNEYRAKPPGQRVWGEFLRTQRQYGFIVREPWEDWLPYMIACDVIITDHTSLAVHGVLVNKPIIRVPVPDEYIWQGSITWEIGLFAPILNDMRRLRDVILNALQNYPMDKLQKLSREINPYPGESGARVSKEVYSLLKLDPPKYTCSGSDEMEFSEKNQATDKVDCSFVEYR
jgi:hypothetical protein